MTTSPIPRRRTSAATASRTGGPATRRCAATSGCSWISARRRPPGAEGRASVMRPLSPGRAGGAARRLRLRLLQRRARPNCSITADGRGHAVLGSHELPERRSATGHRAVLHGRPQPRREARPGQGLARDRLRTDAQGDHARRPERLVDAERHHERRDARPDARPRRPRTAVVDHRAHAREEEVVRQRVGDVQVVGGVEPPKPAPPGEQDRLDPGIANRPHDEVREHLPVVVRHAAEPDAHDRATRREERLQVGGQRPPRVTGEEPVAGHVPGPRSALGQRHHVAAEPVQHRVGEVGLRRPRQAEHLPPCPLHPAADRHPDAELREPV